MLIHVDTDNSELLVNNRFAYVCVSWVQHDAHIYTNDAGKLSRSLSRESSQRTATEVDQQPMHRRPSHFQCKERGPSEEEQGHSLGIGAPIISNSGDMTYTACRHRSSLSSRSIDAR